MILVFGGTTEGRTAIKTLEEAGNVYYYSTKTGEQDVVMHHGRRIDGAMNGQAMRQFCQGHDIRLIVDAAHPFAKVLHQTIADVAEALHLPVVRFERIYPPRDPSLTWIDDYGELASLPTPVTLLATTGVQSIARLKPLEDRGIRIFYRILNRPSSIALAKAQGAAEQQLCYYEDAGDIPVEADAILLKESGESGGFAEKVKAAKARGMEIIVLRRPPMPTGFHLVDGEHGLRRMVEHLLPEFYPLHSGLTTGTCATAAALAAAIRLAKGKMPDEVPVRLPNGETISVSVGYGEDYACCIKESGDDPDVTDGIEIRAHVERAADFEIRGGEGIGRFTLPGFDFPPGEAAINRVPREMIRQNIQLLCDQLSISNFQSSIFSLQFSIILSVPNGREIALRTFNPRLGIEGGISIIGVSGIVKPYSEEAFVQSIRKCMEVARASEAERVVIGSGMKSEQQLRHLYPDLPRQAFVEYGNYIGETLRMADELGFSHVTLGIMIGKAVKLAQGHLDTHSRRVTMDKAFVAQLLREADCSSEVLARVAGITVARELWDLLTPDEAQRFSQVIVSHCREHCAPLLPDGELTILLLRSGD